MILEYLPMMAAIDRLSHAAILLASRLKINMIYYLTR